LTNSELSDFGILIIVAGKEEQWI